MSLEELENVTITSLSKQPEDLFDAPDSVFVITREDILRSGATSIPEALRLAPGVEVTRSGSHSWNISIRGFNNDLSNKLLVLIDGRSVYSPLYAGVFWDAQDTLLEDIDRIEVIEGPGGTIWGANAVNGVINIITRSAADTKGGFAEIGGGSEQGFAGLRYGGTIGNGIAARGYVKYFDRGAYDRSGDGSADDGWRMGQGGFRLDKEAAADHYTLQGDVYSGEEDGIFRGQFTLGTLPGPSFADSTKVSGGNLLGRWRHRQSRDADLRLQVYYDHTRRDIPSTYSERRDTLDLDLQQHLRWGERHDIIAGAGFRLTQDHLDNTLFATFDPADRSDRTYSAFVQDKIDVWARKVFLTLGSKFEHNDYTGFETQPSVRLAWLVNHRQTAWAAVTRAVRVPSRLDSDLRLIAPTSIPNIPFPVYIQVKGNPSLDAEELTAYEAGYRVQALDTLSFDLALFHNHYDELETMEPEAPVQVTSPMPYLVLPNTLNNGMDGESNGGTLAVKWRARRNWRLQLQYAYEDLKLHQKASSQDKSAKKIAGDSPENQFSIFSFLDLPRDISLYTGLRYVGRLTNLNVDSYVAVDASVSWKPGKDLTMSVTAANLNDSGHVEYNNGGMIDVPRSIYGKVTWRF
ncbi:MAG: TonB-dependent receptor [Arenicellales bacterium]